MAQQEGVVCHCSVRAGKEPDRWVIRSPLPRPLPELYIPSYISIFYFPWTLPWFPLPHLAHLPLHLIRAPPCLGSLFIHLISVLFLLVCILFSYCFILSFHNITHCISHLVVTISSHSPTLFRPISPIIFSIRFDKSLCLRQCYEHLMAC